MRKRHLTVWIGCSCARCLDALCSKPSARVKVNVLSDAFHIRNGRRQGCPLSPLIFILTLEPFLKTIRAHPDIKGITTRSNTHKVAAYADLIFFITSLSVSLAGCPIIKLFTVNQKQWGLNYRQRLDSN